jgi:hypothetical protein
MKNEMREKVKYLLIAFIIIVLLPPLSGFFGLIPSPLNWVLGVVMEIFILFYLIVRLGKIKNQIQ